MMKQYRAAWSIFILTKRIDTAREVNVMSLLHLKTISMVTPEHLENHLLGTILKNFASVLFRLPELFKGSYLSMTRLSDRELSILTSRNVN
jgi:hypothetical protein